MNFVIGLDVPIRQGQQKYGFLVMQVGKEVSLTQSPLALPPLLTN